VQQTSNFEFQYWMASAQRRFQPLGSGFKTHRLATCHAVTPRRIESGSWTRCAGAGWCWLVLFLFLFLFLRREIAVFAMVHLAWPSIALGAAVPLLACSVSARTRFCHGLALHS
jgi:hypothetical protein